LQDGNALVTGNLARRRLKASTRYSSGTNWICWIWP